MTEEAKDKKIKKDDHTHTSEKLAEIFIRAAFGGGLSAFVSLVSQSDLPRVALSTLIGGGIAPIILAIGEPISKKLKQRGEQASEATINAVDSATQKAFAKFTGTDAKYLEAQKLACQTDRCQGFFQSAVPLLDEIYVPLSMGSSEISPGWQEKFMETGAFRSNHLTIWQLIRRAEKIKTRQIAILAWGGYGKTTLLKHITYIYCSGQNDRNDIAVPERIPVFLTLGDCWKKYLVGKDVLPGLAETIMKYHIPKLPREAEIRMHNEWAQNNLKNGKMIVLLDGLDEVPKTHRAKVSSWIDEQVGKYSKSMFIVTSRPKAYQEEAKASRISLRNTLWVEPFDDERQRKFIEKWFLYQEQYSNNGRDTADVKQFAQESAEALLTQINARKEIQDLAKIPLLLNMIATFYRSTGKPQLPGRRVDLYQKICDLQLKNRPEAKDLETLLINTDAQAVLQKLALAMLLDNREKSMDRQTLLTCLTQYLKAENETVCATIFLEDVVRISELLIEKDENSYEFSHWNFQEYLAARELLTQEDLLYDKFNDSEWKPTIILYAAQVKKPSGLLQKMIDRGATDLAYACLQETSKQIDAEIQNQLQIINLNPIPIVGRTVPTLYDYVEFEQIIGTSRAVAEIKEVVINARYIRLEELLKTQQWEAADKETYRLMITAVGKEEGQRFNQEDLKSFSCKDLQIIDRLWTRFSDGKFGFSKQRKIWEECSRPIEYSKQWELFGMKVGWYDKSKYSASGWIENINYSIQSASTGGLPFWGHEWIVTADLGGRDGYGGSEFRNEGVSILFSTLIQRIEHCELSSIEGEI